MLNREDITWDEPERPKGNIPSQEMSLSVIDSPFKEGMPSGLSADDITWDPEPELSQESILVRKPEPTPSRIPSESPLPSTTKINPSDITWDSESNIEEPPIIQDSEKPTQKKDLLSSVGESFKGFGTDIWAGAKGFSSGFYKDASNLFGLMDKAATKLSEKTGMDKGGAFEQIQKELEDLSSIAGPTQEEVRPGVVPAIHRAIGTAVPTIAEFASLGKLMKSPTAAFSFLEALKESDKGTQETILGAIKGGLMGGILKAIEPLKAGSRGLTMGGLFGGQAATEGATPEEVIASTVTGAGLGAIGTGRMTLREAVKERIAKPSLLPKEKEIPSEEVQPTTKERTESAAEFSPEEGFRRTVEGTESVEEPIKRSDIASFLQEKLDIPIRTGRFTGGGRGVLGIFKPKEEVVRTKLSNDIETISHEIGHGLQKFLWPESVTSRGYTKDPFPEFRDELKPIATKPKAGQPETTEGFAEFLRYYITNPKEAKDKAPRFYNYFEKTLNEKSPESKEILLDTRKQYDRWIKQPSLARVLGQMSVGEKTGRSVTVDNLYTATIDDLHPLKKIVDQMTQGKELPIEKDPYKLARLSRGWWGKADAFLEHKPFDYKTYHWKGKSLREILTPLKDNLDEFRAYAVSKRTLELRERGIETGILKEDANKIIKDYDPKFKQAFDDLKEYQDNTLRYLKDSGILDGKTYFEIKKLNKDYVPFYRLMESEGTKGAGKGFEVSGPVKRIKGSWRDIVDPLESVVKNTYLFINAAEKNAVGKALVDLANSKEGLGKFVEKIPKVKYKIDVELSEVLKDPELKALAEQTGLREEVVSIFRPSAFQPKDNVISVWNNGERELYQVHPDIARTVKALDKESMNTIVKILSYPSRWLRAGATLAPEFIARNPIRDQFSAFVYSKYGFIPGVDLVKGIFNVVKKSDLYWKWKISGGPHSMLVSLDREYLQKTLDDVIRDKGILSPDLYKSIVKNPVEGLRMLSEFGEAGTRVGEFMKGVKKEGATKEGLLKSAFSSREVTLDFARIGAKTKAVNSLIAFWNANIQGTDKMIRAFKENPIPSIIKAMAAITLPSVILTAINREDKRWKEIPQWQKDLFWIVMTEDHIWRIPKPFELGIIFGTVPERITEFILDKDPKALNGLLKTIGRGASPGIMPTAVTPLIENWANKSFFFERPIVPKGKESLMPEYQYQPYTTEIAKTLSKMISRIPRVGETSAASPAKIENLIRGWSGGLGMLAIKGADNALKKAGVLPEDIKPSSTLSDIPFIKAFTVRYPSSDSESIQRFYDSYKEASQKKSTAKALIEQGKPEEARELLKEGKFFNLDRHYEALRNAHKMIDKVYANPKLTPEGKRQLIDTIYLDMIRIAQDGNEILEGVNK